VVEQSWVIETVGFIAGSLTTASFVPQVLKTIKSRSTRDISLLMWVLFSVGVAVWIAYGFLASSVAIVVTNAVTLILAGIVLIVKLRNLPLE